MPIFALFVYYNLGLFITYKLFKDIPFRVSLFTKAYIISAIFLFLYNFIGIYILELSYSSSIPGAFYADDVTYHEVGKMLSKNLFAIPAYSAGGYTIMWQYIVGVNYAIFGIDTIFPKIFNVFIFSISSLAFYNLGYIISDNKSIAKRGYYLWVFFIPLLYMNATLLRESFMSSLVIFIFYFFIKYQNEQRIKTLLLLLLCLIFLFFTRFEYAIVLIILILFASVFKKGNSVIIRILPVVAILFIAILLLRTNILQKSGIILDILGGGKTTVLYVTGDSGNRINDGSLGVIYSLFKDPVEYLRIFLFGSIQFFVSPLPYIWLTAEVYNNKEQYALFLSFYNMLWYILLPAMYFGIRYKIKFKNLKQIDIVILLSVVIIILLVSLRLTALTRYRLPFLPPLLLYASYGIEYYKLWKNKIGFIVLFYIAIFFLFTVVMRTADIVK